MGGGAGGGGAGGGGGGGAEVSVLFLFRCEESGEGSFICMALYDNL